MIKAIRTVLAVSILGGCAMAQQFTLPVQQGTLKRVEQISADEKAELQKAADAVTKAQADFEAAKSKVATAHKMTRENYMEWSSWYEFDGDFILQRFSFNIVNHVGW